MIYEYVQINIKLSIQFSLIAYGLSNILYKLENKFYSLLCSMIAEETIWLTPQDPSPL